MSSLREQLEEAVCDNCPAIESCEENLSPICDLKFKIDAIRAAVAEWIKGLPEKENPYPLEDSPNYEPHACILLQDTNERVAYRHGTLDERENILDQLGKEECCCGAKLEGETQGTGV